MPVDQIVYVEVPVPHEVKVVHVVERVEFKEVISLIPNHTRMPKGSLKLKVFTFCHLCRKFHYLEPGYAKLAQTRGQGRPRRPRLEVARSQVRLVTCSRGRR